MIGGGFLCGCSEMDEALTDGKKESPKNGSSWGFGADGRTRTGDLLITNQLLYQLSHTSVDLFNA